MPRLRWPDSIIAGESKEITQVRSFVADLSLLVCAQECRWAGRVRGKQV